MRRLATLLICLAAAALPGVARADCEALPQGSARADQAAAHVPPSAALVRELTLWIAAETGYDVTRTLDDPPEIVFCDPGERVPYEDDTILVEQDLEGAYDLPARRIYLVAPWTPDAVRDQAVLLHELIHDVQFSAREWECITAPEWEAYQLTAKWLAAHRVEPGFDWLQIYFLSRCPRDIHP
jgi:hypothetical protein